ncbi:MAG: acyl-CoA dehydrogenase family protein [Candidatus Eisenbacteria bacterium]|uniref:Acyl-CoA dehydrogenase family protein n=1 Tax=Eiseniibacteriota bacterium TaxID=2212470 RepID=A0A948W5K3_UNCEI|nr:acyl-CoA dehydrogenase family protein [Candidatus Eisenbacteria bacterium]MBU1947415.1 acyl-CoA dehydrogenase family protein [Candidatus Eisenbacteria bacterium]MBU2693397.1 acyl-CoA dehydrogenase family protein [Candidatus Eisenbacteria bacterium]
MKSHQLSDFYEVDALFNEEERAVRDTVRQFVTEKFMPRIREDYRAGRFPVELIPQMGELGLLGSNIEGYDCPGMSHVVYGIIQRELERGDSGLRSFSSVQGSLVMYPIATFGSEEQKQRWLPRLARGEAIGCYGLTEADHGSDPGAMETTARRVGDHWILNGAKMWITNGSIADLAVVFAKTDEGIRGFLVEKGFEGFTAPEIRHKWSLRASVTSELVFQDCAVPAENMLPGTSSLKQALMCLNQARYGIAWGALGAAAACLEEAMAFAQQRIQFRRPVASFQLIQTKLTEMVTELTKGQLLALQLGRLKDQGKATPARVSLAKRNNVYHARAIARTAREILAAGGITDEYHSGRHMTNLESVLTYEGTHDIQGLIVGAALTGHEAFA